MNQQKHALFEKYQAMVSDEYWKSRLEEAKLLSNKLAKHRSRYLSNNFLLLFPIIEVDEESFNVGSPRVYIGSIDESVIKNTMAMCHKKMQSFGRSGFGDAYFLSHDRLQKRVWDQCLFLN